LPYAFIDNINNNNNINHQLSSTMAAAIVSPNDMIHNISTNIPEEDDFFPTEWNCSKCNFLNNDDESSCQNIVGGDTCSTRRHIVSKPSWDGTFFAKLQVSQTGSSLHSTSHSHYTHPRYSKTAANNEPRVSGSNEAVCTAGNSGLAEKKKKTPRMLRELESTLGDYWKGSGKRGSRRRQ